jgi:hypothetical protein
LSTAASCLAVSACSLDIPTNGMRTPTKKFILIINDNAPSRTIKININKYRIYNIYVFRPNIINSSSNSNLQYDYHHHAQIFKPTLISFRISCRLSASSTRTAAPNDPFPITRIRRNFSMRVCIHRYRGLVTGDTTRYSGHEIFPFCSIIS